MFAAEADASEIKVQHETLLETLRAVEELLPYVSACRGRPRPLAAARALLDRLADQLRVHFAAEESDAHFGRIASGDPRLARRIARLLQDHRELRALAAALGDGVRHSDEDAAWSHASRAFWQLRERLAWHEREENDLMFEACLVDLGQGAGG